MASRIPHVNFILSAGRTGTVFLYDALKRRSSRISVYHEPWPGRYGLMIANMRHRFRTSGRILLSILRYGISKRINRAVRSGRYNYVEINPFLCASTDLIPHLNYKFGVLHIVRDPLSWARSITAFKASGYFRYIIDFIPFSKPSPEPRPDGWHDFTALEKALWRWRFCNEAIESLKHNKSPYLLIRYEDIFSEQDFTRNFQAEKICKFLRIENNGGFNISKRLNPSPKKRPLEKMPSPQLIKLATTPLADRFGYDIDRYQ